MADRRGAYQRDRADRRGAYQRDVADRRGAYHSHTHIHVKTGLPSFISSPSVRHMADKGGAYQRDVARWKE